MGARVMFSLAAWITALLLFSSGNVVLRLACLNTSEALFMIRASLPGAKWWKSLNGLSTCVARQTNWQSPKFHPIRIRLCRPHVINHNLVTLTPLQRKSQSQWYKTINVIVCKHSLLKQAAKRRLTRYKCVINSSSRRIFQKSKKGSLLQLSAIRSSHKRSKGATFLW